MIPYAANKVTWMGTHDSMVKITLENSEPTKSNNFNKSKLSEFERTMREGESVFESPLVIAYIVTPEDIARNLVGIRYGVLKPDPATGRVHRLSTGDETLDEYLWNQKICDNKDEMETLLELARVEKWGDVGNVRYHLRDGNHRRVAAFAAGEPYVWARMENKDINS